MYNRGYNLETQKTFKRLISLKRNIATTRRDLRTHRTPPSEAWCTISSKHYPPPPPCAGDRRRVRIEGAAAAPSSCSPLGLVERETKATFWCSVRE